MANNSGEPVGDGGNWPGGRRGDDRDVSRDNDSRLSVAALRPAPRRKKLSSAGGMKMSKTHLQPSCVPVNDRLRVLVVSDSVERLRRIRAALTGHEIEITCASSPEEMCRGCCGWQDLAAVDVDPKRIAEVLMALRQCAGCTKISVLVEASRISTDPSLAGLLPACRAMPCGYDDLIKLARNLLAPTPEERSRPGLL